MPDHVKPKYCVCKREQRVVQRWTAEQRAQHLHYQDRWCSHEGEAVMVLLLLGSLPLPLGLSHLC